MAIKKLVPASHPILTKSASSCKIDDSLKRLLQDLEDTMYAQEAAGLCAPQIISHCKWQSLIWKWKDYYNLLIRKLLVNQMKR